MRAMSKLTSVLLLLGLGFSLLLRPGLHEGKGTAKGKWNWSDSSCFLQCRLPAL